LLKSFDLGWMRSPLRRGLAVLMLALWAGASAAAQIDVVLSDDSPVYADAAQALQEALAGLASVRLTNLADPEPDRRPGDDTVLQVTIGARALAATLESARRPVLGIAVTRSSFERMMRSAEGRQTRQVSAIYLDQPLARQINLVRLLLPRAERVGVLVAAENAPALKALENLAVGAGLSVAAESVGSPQDVYAALKKLLPRSDLLLAIPDPAIYNSTTLHNILLSALRANQPVIASSPSFVRAGALAAAYTTNVQFARQAAAAALRIIRQGSLPPPEYPREFEIVVNSATAASLGLTLDEAARLRAQLQAMERER
jgi:ABC-type uncharacterized transport system substrate-binding protein